MAAFGDVLQGLREKAGLSQRELADLAGTSQKAISFWEMGKRDPTLSNLQKLCDALGVKCDVFFAATEAAPEQPKRGRPKGKAK
jgi:repressor LexA